MEQNRTNKAVSYRGFGLVLIVLILFTIGTEIRHRQFLFKNAWQQAVSHHDSAEDRLKQIMDSNETSFLEYRAGRYVRFVAGSLYPLLIIVFLYLGIRQVKLQKRLRELEQLVEQSETVKRGPSGGPSQ